MAVPLGVLGVYASFKRMAVHLDLILKEWQALAGGNLPP
jgi:hypothetical protein